ncbi:MAG: enoyl-CoA hydratase/isomerase family protein, partial [Actinomycetota bacterium]
MSLSVDRFGDDGKCVMATLNRPDKRNAVDMAMLRSLQELCAEVDGCRVLMVHGAEPAFCSGADLEGVELGEFTDTLAAVLESLSNLPCLTLAAIEGPALGAGLQLASACDLRMASAESAIGVPAVK